MQRSTVLVAALAGVVALAGMGARAEVRLPAVFSEHMVLQQGVAAPVWGWATPGEAVTVELGGQTVKATAGAEGRWRCRLGPLAAGGPLVLTVAGANRIEIQDVHVGEVWFCGGQSNMEFPLERANNAAAEIAAAKDPRIRMFTARNVVAAEPREEVDGRWVVCSPETAGKFSALGYLFGREICGVRNVPVGLVHASAGWTPAEAWTPREALLGHPDLRYIAERWDAVAAAYPEAKARYEKAMAEWQAASDKAKAEGREAPPQPSGPADPQFIHRASGLYNGSVHPLIPYGVRGVIWYQGETNDSRGYQYRKLFPALINGWRAAWGREDLPFLFVQVANVLPPDPTPVDSEWAELRESQALALALPHTGMAVTIDIGEEKDVHPKNKQEAARRLALVARATVYGEDVPCSGPVYKAMRVEDDAVHLAFDHVHGGLVAGGDAALSGFAIAGADRRFVYAEARVVGDEVVVRNAAVTAPVAVRYAWANNPAGCNLYNRAGLPAVPFRTDDWPAKTQDSTALFIDQH